MRFIQYVLKNLKISNNLNILITLNKPEGDCMKEGADHCSQIPSYDASAKKEKKQLYFLSYD